MVEFRNLHSNRSLDLCKMVHDSGINSWYLDDMIKLRRMRWVGYTVCMVVVRNSFSILVLKPQRKKLFVGVSHRRLALTETGCEGWTGIEMVRTESISSVESLQSTMSGYI